MFCPKCGAQAADDAAFCQKCGAPLNADDAAQLSNPPNPAKKAKKSATSGKKKSGKLLPIILVIVLVAIAVHFISSSGDDSDYENMTELTQTFHSESDGITFQYPKAWRVSNDDDNKAIVVKLVNPDIYSFIIVWRFEIPELADVLYDMDDELFVETLVNTDSAPIQSLQSVSEAILGDVWAREARFTTPNSLVEEVQYRSYFYSINSVLYRIDCIKKDVNPIDVDRVFDAILLGSYKVSTTD